jgi:predicted RNase H-like HicB family nuclease
MRYSVIYEKTGTGYSAYAPDLPGCIATGHTLDVTKRRMKRAMEMHLAAMHADKDPIPEPTTEAGYIEVPGYTPTRARDSLGRSLIIERISASAERK